MGGLSTINHKKHSYEMLICNTLYKITYKGTNPNKTQASGKQASRKVDDKLKVVIKLLNRLSLLFLGLFFSDRILIELCKL